MQSYTTQSHQRNYQGKVVLPETKHTADTRPKQNKFFGIVAASIMALAIALTGSLLGATTLHNQQLKHQVHALQTQITQTAAPQPNQDNRDTEQNHSDDEREEHPHRHHHKNLRRIPISEKHHETQPMPSVDNQRGHSANENDNLRLH